MRASQRKQTPEVGQASGQMLAGPEGASVSTSRGSPRAAFACCADGQKPVEAGQGSAPGRHHCAHRGLSPSSGSSVSSLSPLRPPRSADRAGLAHAQDSRTLWCHNCRYSESLCKLFKATAVFFHIYFIHIYSLFIHIYVHICYLYSYLYTYIHIYFIFII